MARFMVLAVLVGLVCGGLAFRLEGRHLQKPGNPIQANSDDDGYWVPTQCRKADPNNDDDVTRQLETLLRSLLQNDCKSTLQTMFETAKNASDKIAALGGPGDAAETCALHLEGGSTDVSEDDKVTCKEILAILASARPGETGNSGSDMGRPIAVRGKRPHGGPSIHGNKRTYYHGSSADSSGTMYAPATGTDTASAGNVGTSGTYDTSAGAVSAAGGAMATGTRAEAIAIARTVLDALNYRFPPHMGTAHDGMGGPASGAAGGYNPGTGTMTGTYPDSAGTMTGTYSDPAGTMTGTYSDPAGTMTGTYSDPAGTMTGTYSDPATGDSHPAAGATGTDYFHFHNGAYFNGLTGEYYDSMTNTYYYLTGAHYDPASGTSGRYSDHTGSYFDPNTGWFYDSSSQSYHHASGTYFDGQTGQYYDSMTGTYYYLTGAHLIADGFYTDTSGSYMHFDTNTGVFYDAAGEPHYPPAMYPDPAVATYPASGPGPYPAPASGPYPAPASGPYPSPASGPYPSPATGPYPSPATGPYPSPATGPYPSPVTGPYPAPASGPYPAPASGPYPSPASGPYPSPASGPYPSPASGPYPSPASGPYPSPAAGPVTIGDRAKQVFEVILQALQSQPYQR